jgi:hypothetical protein
MRIFRKLWILNKQSQENKEQVGENKSDKKRHSEESRRENIISCMLIGRTEWRRLCHRMTHPGG